MNQSLLTFHRGHWQHLKEDDLVYLKDVDKSSRVKARFIPLKERKNTFNELFPTFTKEEINTEGKRCIECSCTDKSECKLKEFSEKYAADPEAIPGEKILSGYDNRHPKIIHDRMKCIKCGICVKVCSEVVNQNLLSQKQRGFSTKVETAFGTPLPNSCTECGACIEECPVGALAWKLKDDV